MPRLSRSTLVTSATFLIAMIATASAMPAQAHAASEPCNAQATNGKPLGKRFGKLAGRAAFGALTGRKASARANADAAVRDTIDSARENGETEAANAACRASQGVGSDGSRQDGGGKERDEDVTRPHLIPVSDEIRNAKKAFDEFGKVACHGCEGGYTFESWANQFFASELRGQADGWEKKLAAMTPGETLNWQGSENYGTIEMTGDTRVSGFDCKTYAWKLERDASQATRDGLLCFGKSSPYSASDSWVEVY